MTQDEIRKIAKEYSDSVDWEDYEDEQAELLSAHKPYQNAKSFLEWLSEHYFIVEKSKVRELYKKMELDGCHVDTDNDWAIYEAMDKLVDIFGTDAFKEE